MRGASRRPLMPDMTTLLIHSTTLIGDACVRDIARGRSGRWARAGRHGSPSGGLCFDILFMVYFHSDSPSGTQTLSTLRYLLVSLTGQIPGCFRAHAHTRCAGTLEAPVDACGRPLMRGIGLLGQACAFLARQDIDRSADIASVKTRKSIYGILIQYKLPLYIDYYLM